MRIIGGKYRGRKLKSPPTVRTRPTSDRLREALFNILAPRIEGARFLDLCAGTGAVGIEALSRGAAQVTFVDKSRTMCALIEANLWPLQVEKERYVVITSEAAAFLRNLSKVGAPSLTVGLLPRSATAFDLVFFDPPYAADYEAVLELFGEHDAKLLSEDAPVIVEHHKKKDLAEEFEGLKRYRELRQGDSVLSFYRAGSQ